MLLLEEYIQSTGYAKHAYQWRTGHGAMESAVVVLKHETSPLRQSHNFISIHLKFGVGDYVREVTSPDKFGSDPMSGRVATWVQHIRVLRLLFGFFCFVFYNRATANTGEPIFAHNSSKDAFWCEEDSFGDEKCVVVKFWGVLP